MLAVVLAGSDEAATVGDQAARVIAT